MSISKPKVGDSTGEEGEELNAWSSTKTLTAYQEARKYLTLSRNDDSIWTTKRSGLGDWQPSSQRFPSH